MEMDTVSPEHKPLKSSKDWMDLLSLVRQSIYFGINECLYSVTKHFRLEGIDMFSRVRSHFSSRMGYKLHQEWGQIRSPQNASLSNLPKIGWIYSFQCNNTFTLELMNVSIVLRKSLPLKGLTCSPQCDHIFLQR